MTGEYRRASRSTVRADLEQRVRQGTVDSLAIIAAAAACLLLMWLRDWRLPSRESAADTLLIFVAKPDDAEAILGDLLEQMEKVRARKSAFVIWLWFWSEVLCAFGYRLCARIMDNPILKKITDALIGRLSR